MAHFSALYDLIKRSRAEIIGLGEQVYRTPETGFAEVRTARCVAAALDGLHPGLQSCPDLPALKLTLDTGRPGPGVAILGELDALLCPSHPDADPATGAVHACGHHVQIGALYGAALGLVRSGIIDQLCGKIHLLAVPAEEFIEIERRKAMIAQGRLTFLGGKAELLARGWFDDIDICLMIHVYPLSGPKLAFQSANGVLVKEVRFIGRAAHAGAAPHMGVNALYAAQTALTALNGLRETFREQDCIRIHPIMTRGGSVVNVIPDDVRLETFVRGRTDAAVQHAAGQFDRAMAGGALALGAGVEIDDSPGAFPYIPDPGLCARVRQAMAGVVDAGEILDLGHTTSSTDLGDLAAVMPVIQPYVGGVSGGLHEPDFRIVDPDLAYLVSAQLLAGTAATLLSGQAEAARQIIRAYQPTFSSPAELVRTLRSRYVSKRFPQDAQGFKLETFERNMRQATAK